jgi:hypothetical protein
MTGLDSGILRNSLVDAKVKKTIAREGLIFITLFGISYLVYLIFRFTNWRIKRLKEKSPVPK